MATLTNNEIEQLQQQFKEKTEEIRAIYDKLAEAGAVPVPDDTHPQQPLSVPPTSGLPGCRIQRSE